MNIGEVSDYLKITKKAINLYEEKGLLRPNKNSNGYRLYGEEEIKTLKQIKILRSLDLSLSEIKDIIINNEYCFFDNKLSELKIRDYDLQKKIQYLDLVKNDFIQNEIIENIEEYRELLIRESKEEIKDKNIYVDFEKILIVVFTFFTTISICGRGRISGEIIIIIYLLILICSTALLHYPQSRKFFYQLYQKLQEYKRKDK